MISLLSRKPRLLLLDDDPAMQRLVSAVMRGAGYRIDVVSAADQAIEKLKKTDYAALLLDLMTPTEGGMTVIRHLKKVNPSLLRRVVLVTASPDAVLRSVQGDVAAVVHKPFEAAQLVSTVGKVAAGS